MAKLGKIYKLEVNELKSGTLPLFNPKKWGFGYLIFGVVVAFVFGMTMVDFFKAAFGM